jgi:hypothetical protein
LLLDEYDIGGENPWSRIEMIPHGDIDTIGMLWGNTIDIPFTNEITSLFVE